MRIEQLTFTRFIAAIAVVMMHFGKHVFPFSHESIGFLVKSGGVGVSYFFILSGFVMVIAYGKNPNIDFLSYQKNRFARIYPVYLLGLILVLFYILFIVQQEIGFKEIMLHASALQAWVPETALNLNFPGWSVSVEFFFYLLFPFIYNYFYTKQKFKTILFVSIILWFISLLFINWALKGNIFYISEKNTLNFLHSFPLFHLNQFLIGNIAGFYFLEKWNTKSKNYDLHILLVFIVLIALIKMKLPVDYSNGFLAIVFLPLILLQALNTGSLTRLFKSNAAVFLGEISYSIYILHYPIHLFVKYFLKMFGINGELKLLLIYIPVLIVFSALSYTYIETPLREKIKKTRIPFK